MTKLPISRKASRNNHGNPAARNVSGLISGDLGKGELRLDSKDFMLHLEPIFEIMGFTKVATHRSKNVHLFRQGEINLILNNEPNSIASYFAAEHGPSVCGMAFRVKDSQQAYNRALELGAQPIEIPTGPMELNLLAEFLTLHEIVCLTASNEKQALELHSGTRAHGRLRQTPGSAG